jgi:hypothetical protein
MARLPANSRRKNQRYIGTGILAGAVVILKLIIS